MNPGPNHFLSFRRTNFSGLDDTHIDLNTFYATHSVPKTRVITTLDVPLRGICTYLSVMFIFIKTLFTVNVHDSLVSSFSPVVNGTTSPFGRTQSTLKLDPELSLYL